MSDDNAALPFEHHDHSRCTATAMAEAERVCSERGAQLTKVRRRVLELLWESHRPVGAYALLDRLKAEGLGSQPPTVYRALDFLIAQGLAHKIAKINAFAACCTPGESHAPQFLICTGCDRISEISDPEVTSALDRAAEKAGFSAAGEALEVTGLCPSCAPKDGVEPEAPK